MEEIIEETVTSNPHEAQEFWENEFTGENINPTELEFAKVVFNDYCTDGQRKSLEAEIDSQGSTLGSSRTLIKYLAQVGDRLLANKDERDSSPSASFYGDEMADAEERSVHDDAKHLINNAIDKATSEIILKGRRPLPGRMHK